MTLICGAGGRVGRKLPSVPAPQKINGGCVAAGVKFIQDLGKFLAFGVMKTGTLANLGLTPGFTSIFIGAMIGLMPSLGEGPIMLLLLLAIVMLVLEPRMIAPRDLKIIAPLIVYTLAMFAMNLFHSHGEIWQSSSNFYIVQALMAILLFNMLNAYEFDRQKAAFACFMGLFVSIAILAADYYTDWNGNECRAQAFSGNPQWVAGFLVVIAFSLSALALQQKRLNFLALLGLNALVIVGAGAFSGARMSFYAAIVLSLFLAAALIYRRDFKRGLAMAGALLVGLGGTFALDNVNSCGFTARIVSQLRLSPAVVAYFNTTDAALSSQIDQKLNDLSHLETPPSVPATDPAAENPAQPALQAAQTGEIPPVSEGRTEIEVQEIIFSGASRAAMWRNAIEAIQERPIMGHGQDAEPAISVRNLDTMPNLIHVHNQFLSWMIWGGVFGLLVGLYAIFGMVAVSASPLTAITFGLALSVIFMSESFLVFPFNTNIIIAAYVFISAVSGKINRQT